MRRADPVTLSPTTDVETLRRELVVQLNRLVNRVDEERLIRDLDAGGHRIKNLSRPVERKDAVTVEYLEEQVGGGTTTSASRAASATGVPTGSIIAYGGTAAPAGWLLCDGAAVSRSGYGALFAAVGVAYGTGDGSATFNVPDLRGRFGLGKDNMGGTSANRVTGTQADNLGEAAGAETHALITAELAAHTHDPGTLSAAANGSHTHSYDKTTDPGGGMVESGPYAAVGSLTITPTDTDSPGTHIHTLTGTSASAGSGTAHNNMSPYQTVNYIVKT